MSEPSATICLTAPTISGAIETTWSCGQSFSVTRTAHQHVAHLRVAQLFARASHKHLMLGRDAAGPSTKLAGDRFGQRWIDQACKDLELTNHACSHLWPRRVAGRSSGEQDKGRAPRLETVRTIRRAASPVIP
jgi:hypothetical protein